MGMAWKEKKKCGKSERDKTQKQSTNEKNETKKRTQRFYERAGKHVSWEGRKTSAPKEFHGHTKKLRS